MVADAEPAKHVTVVGGGFVGAIFAHHLLRLSPRPVRIDVVEPRDRLGAGVAYSAYEPHQTTNIPAARMSVDPGDPTHFVRWLAAQPDQPSEADEDYPNRSSFGAYMKHLLQSTVPRHPGSTLRHRRTAIAQIARGDADLAVQTRDGQAWPADAVALATGNPVPVPPTPLARCAGDPRVILDPWAPGAVANVHADARILVLGIGLSMGEAVAGLAHAGHRGPIVAIARRGRRSERGMVAAPTPFGDFKSVRPQTAVALLRHFRAEVRGAVGAGLSWRSVLAAARPEAWALWGSLSATERRRAVRHLRPYWEALRHVMPGPVYDRLEQEEREGRLEILAASLVALEPHAGGIDAVLHPRGAGAGTNRRERFDIVLNCTGPAYATLTETDPFWAGLARTGLVRRDAVGLGIDVDSAGRALDETGRPQPELLVLGTLARGTFGELTGVPELSRQAREAAAALAKAWDAGQHPVPTPILEETAG